MIGLLACVCVCKDGEDNTAHVKQLRELKKSYVIGLSREFIYQSVGQSKLSMISLPVYVSVY